MKLALTLTSYQRLSTTQDTDKALGSGRLTIGRGPDNDWVLPDPNRFLSKKHCEIAFTGEGYVLTDTSTNGVFLNGAAAPLGNGARHLLRDGDVIQLGDYRIGVRLLDDDADPAFGLDEPEDPGAIDPFAALGPGFPDDDVGDVFGVGSGSGPAAPGSARRSDPDGGFDDLFGPEPGEAPASRPGSGRGEGFGDDHSAEPSPFSAFEDDSGLFEDEADKDPAPRRGGSAPDHTDPLSDAFRPPEARPSAAPSGGLDDDWDDELADILGNGPAPAPAPSPAPSPAPGPAPPSPPPAAPPRPPSPPQPPTPPRPPAPPESPSPPPSAAPRPAAAAGTGAGGEDLLAAFLRGAGLPPEAMAGADPDATMEEVGRAFREMVDGLRQLLLARSEIKNEMRVERTVLQSVDNNPLKFAPDAEEALRRLVGPRRQAYKPAVEAVREGFGDLRAHEMAVMAGTQAAIRAMLQRFDPDTLAARLEGKSVLESLMPSARKARVWDLYRQQYAELAREAEESFDDQLRREFAKAYEQLVRSM